MAVTTYTKTGTKATTAAKLDSSVFGIKEISHELLHQAYNAYLSNGRTNLAVTKTRGLVRGSGRKPWRQKGTGRARVGSRRTPVWRGGGIVFGPTGEENYTKRLNTQAKRSAIRQALSLAATENRISIIEDINLKQSKTSELVKLLDKVGAKGYTLVVAQDLSNELKLASRNLPDVKAVQSKYVNVARVLDADSLVITKQALDEIVDWLKPAKTAVEKREK